MKKMPQKFVLRTITAVILASFVFLGSDCEDILNPPPNNNTDCTGSNVNVVGTWRFTQNLGGVRDVCLGETVVFSSNGTATLTCPNQSAITRTYSISSDFILTYNETGMKYCLSGNTNELQLTGKNNNRILYYVRTATDTKNDENSETLTDNNVKLINSSELK